MLATTRPIVEFNVQNETHRGWFGHFLHTGSMRDSPILFSVRDNETGNQVGTIQRLLLEYYTQKEFTVVEKTVDSIAV